MAVNADSQSTAVVSIWSRVHRHQDTTASAVLPPPACGEQEWFQIHNAVNWKSYLMLLYGLMLAMLSVSTGSSWRELISRVRRRCRPLVLLSWTSPAAGAGRSVYREQAGLCVGSGDKPRYRRWSLTSAIWEQHKSTIKNVFNQYNL